MIHLVKYVKYNESQSDYEDIQQILRIGQDDGYESEFLTLSFSTHTIWLRKEENNTESREHMIEHYRNMISRLDQIINITKFQIFATRGMSRGTYVTSHGQFINTNDLIFDFNSNMESDGIRLYFDFID